ncbi:hypothetical protein F3D3_3208 [Fusibacter sp. 3D3]|nr:hypothetical protein F3D3_3208 [Fusibacter sp. 3D3]
MDAVIREILKKNEINEAFIKLETHGIANEIYATPNFILRIPTEHPEANADAYTESVAAPLAKSIGIKTPKMICFDDSYTVLDRTYSIWERIHGSTLGELDNYLNFYHTWYEIGCELGKLHVSIKKCDDPKGWLDSPDREYTKEMLIEGVLARDNYVDKHRNQSAYLLKLIECKFTDETFFYEKCFVHGDTNIFNFLCTPNDQLLSIIDWGDAGWADPAIDFYRVPVEVLDTVLDGYTQMASINVDSHFIYRLIFDKIWTAIEEKQDLFGLEDQIMILEKNLLKKMRQISINPL